MKAFVIAACSVLVMAAAQSAEAALPAFTYSLTEKSSGDRIQICNLNMGFCQTNCQGPNKAPKNFCNSTTMGWGCGCNDKIPDLQGYQWPINQQDCIGRGEACKAACTAGDSSCITSCTSTYTATCGTDKQPPAYYNVENVNDIPTYGPPTTNSSSASNSTSGSGNSTTGSSNSSASAVGLCYSLGTILSALAVVAGGMMLI